MTDTLVAHRPMLYGLAYRLLGSVVARPIEVNGGPAVVVRSATMFHVVALAAHDDGGPAST